jgi:thioredoxin reductase
MNRQVDVIVIGDSPIGNEAVKQIAAKKPTIKMAFVSREFKSTTTHDFLNVEYIKDTVTLVDYKNRLFGCYLSNGDRLYSTHLIVASGLKYEPLVLNNKPVPNVFNSTADIPKYAKNQPAVVVGKHNSDAKFAIDVAKKHKYVYLCTEGLTLENITPANVKKLAATENIIVLPNARLRKLITTDGMLEAVELDNYSTIKCSAIFVKTATMPETAFLPANIIKKTSDGFLETTKGAESALVPKCFALGNCAIKSTKSMLQSVVTTVLNDF